jgi:hypothetical protein
VHGLAEAVQVEVDEDVLRPLAVGLQAQDGLREGAVVLCDALVLSELAQLLDSALMAPRVLEVGGEGVDLLAVGLAAAVLAMPGVGKTFEAPSCAGQQDALLVGGAVEARPDGGGPD